MESEILSGVVTGYHYKGLPVARIKGKVIFISGYTTAHKTPIGNIAEFMLTESHINFDIAKIVNESPASTIGTISSHANSGHAMMDCCRKLIHVTGCFDKPAIGTDIEYRTVVEAPNFDVAWFADKDDPIGFTVEFINYRSNIMHFICSSEKDSFKESITDIGQSYLKGYPEYALMKIEKLYDDMGKRLKGDNDRAKGRYDIVNGLKFFKVMIEENYSIKSSHPIPQSTHSK